LDTEIYEAVIDAIKARENLEINGGDDVDEDFPVESRPIRWDVLHAVSTIGKYVEDMDAPLARNIEAILSSFNKQFRLEETRSLKDTAITDFLSKNIDKSSSN
ncbi:hypothetical protein CPB84DRAFT_1685422, partial [Gymnopilus junonius]